MQVMWGLVLWAGAACRSSCSPTEDMAMWNRVPAAGPSPDVPLSRSREQGLSLTEETPFNQGQSILNRNRKCRGRAVLVIMIDAEIRSTQYINDGTEAADGGWRMADGRKNCPVFSFFGCGRGFV